jgi:hypothetical protein
MRRAAHSARGRWPGRTAGTRRVELVYPCGAGGSCWPWWWWRSSASAATARCRWWRVALSQSARSAMTAGSWTCRLSFDVWVTRQRRNGWKGHGPIRGPTSRTVASSAASPPCPARPPRSAGPTGKNAAGRDHNPDALARAGCEEVFIDKAAGRLARRPELDRALLVASHWTRSSAQHGSGSHRPAAGIRNPAAAAPELP